MSSGAAGMMEPMALTWLLVGIGDISTKRILPAILAEPHSRLAGIVTRDPAKAAPYGVPGWQSLEAAASRYRRYLDQADSARDSGGTAQPPGGNRDARPSQSRAVWGARLAEPGGRSGRLPMRSGLHRHTRFFARFANHRRAAWRPARLVREAYGHGLPASPDHAAGRRRNRAHTRHLLLSAHVSESGAGARIIGGRSYRAPGFRGGYVSRLVLPGGRGAGVAARPGQGRRRSAV